MRSPTLPSPNDFEKRTSSSLRANTRKRRGIVFGLLTLAVLSLFYLSPSTTASATNSLSVIWTKIKSIAGCHSTPVDTMPHHHGTHTAASAEGWHARATHTPATDFNPKQSDLVLSVLVNSQVEPDGFTLSLLHPNLAVDASGKLLVLSAADFAAFEAQVHAVTAHVEPTGEFMGQWRVKQARTGYPIDRVLIPGDAERAVYGWAKSNVELKLEGETKGRTTLPKELQVLVGWAKEARDGYVRGHKDDTVISKVRALIQE